MFRQIRGCNDKSFGFQKIKLLHQGDYDAIEFTHVANITSLSTQGIDLIKEQYARVTRRELEQLAQVNRGLAQVSADYCVKPNHIMWQSHFICESQRGQALSTSRMAQKQKLISPTYPLHSKPGAMFEFR